MHSQNFAALFEWTYKPSSIYTTVLGFVVTICWLIHSNHVSTMFENDTQYTYLGTLEKEMVFRSEMAMYLSFYKRIIFAESYARGLLDIINDTRTEYPSVINSLQQFNLYPEVICAGLYRITTALSNMWDLKFVECWIVNRAYGEDVTGCVGYGEPIYFYLTFVWACAGFTMAVLFLFGLEISGSLLGGAFTVMCFMYNHSEATSIQWTPALRESFGYPCCLLQMLVVTKFLKFSTSYKAALIDRKKPMTWISDVINIMCPTAAFLILWRFSHFIIMTQLIVVLSLYCLGSIDCRACFVVTLATALAIILSSLALFLDKFLLLSTLMCLVVSMLLVLFFELCRPVWLRYKVITVPLFIVGLTILVKSYIGFHDDDDVHIMNLLKAKFTSHKDFHTLMHACTEEFDFLPYEYIQNINSTFLLPTVLIGVIGILIHWLRLITLTGFNYRCWILARNVIDPGLAYNILQAIIFAVMAALVMRWKLLLTPHLCLLASSIFHSQFLPRSSKKWFATCFILLLGLMAIQGITNIEHERNFAREYFNTPLEELLNWVLSSTNPDAVFAGPLPLIAHIMLSTGRRVVNHPHNENYEARKRTMQVYSIFSRKNHFEVHDMLMDMGVEYIIVSENLCFGRNREGCNMGDFWDVHDPQNIDRELLCPDIIEMNPFPFRLVFINGAYVIFGIDRQWSHSAASPHTYVDKVTVVNITINQYS